jgi:peptidoglycan/xylan/chitin deacetylase (PgdA/CDA1 family)
MVPARLGAIEPKRPIVSFTFDDAPASSLTGASILESHGVRGTFYIAGGLVGAKHDGQAMLSATECKSLVARGHELGCHTFSHQTPRRRIWNFAAELDRNVEFFSGVMDRPPQNFAFPYGLSAPWLPGTLGRRFRTSRGVIAGINRHATNLDQLRSVEIRPGVAVDSLLGWIDAVVVHPGWLIYFTHDVSDAPSPFGSTPATLERLVDHALELGCEVLTVDKALDRLEERA